jgi:hypothetical protein
METNVFVTPRLGEDRCIMFGSTNAMSHDLYKKSSVCFY